MKTTHPGRPPRNGLGFTDITPEDDGDESYSGGMLLTADNRPDYSATPETTPKPTPRVPPAPLSAEEAAAAAAIAAEAIKEVFGPGFLEEIREARKNRKPTPDGPQ